MPQGKDRVGLAMSALKPKILNSLTTIFMVSGMAFASCMLFIHESRMCDMEEEKNIQRAKDNLAEFNRDTGKDYQIVGSNRQYTAIIPFTPIPMQGAASPFTDKAEMIQKHSRARADLEASYKDLQDNDGCAMQGSASIGKALKGIIEDYRSGSQFSRRPVLEQI